MSNSIQIAGASFSNVLTALSLPDRASLLCEYVFGTNAAASIRNIANLAANATEVGAVASLAIGSAGSGGTDGAYSLAFSGGGGGSGAAGTFTVTGGAVTGVSLTNGGTLYSTAPAASTAACPGLTGAAITVTKSVPTYSSGYLTSKSASPGNGLSLGLTPSNNCTMIIVRQRGSTLGSDTAIAGCGSSNKFGFDESSTTAYFKCGSSNNAHGAQLPVPAVSTWAFQAGVASYLGAAKGYYAATPGASLTEVVDTNNAIGAAAPLYIGAGALTGQNYSYPIAYFAVYNKQLSLADLNIAYMSLRSYLALRSIAI
jgi:hypothetical protein